MPTINDAIVVSGSGYTTAGNGGRKLVRLDNRWIVSAVMDRTTTYGAIRLYVSKDEGSTFSQLCYVDIVDAYTNANDVAIVNNGNFIYLIANTKASAGIVNFWVINAETQQNVDINSLKQIVDSNQQTTEQFISLAINEAKTELHAVWSSKNSSYPNSFNIRYAKGTINENGTVTWGAVEQITNSNVSGYNYSDLTIAIIDKKPSIICEYYNGTSYYLINHSTVFTDRDFNTNAPSNWGNKIIIGPVGYAQSSPSAIYVPQSINGLVNGRIWVTWHGMDATDTSVTNIRVSYSDNGGSTWSAMQKLTSGNTYSMYYPSITANKENEISILYTSNASSYGLNKIKNINNFWQSATIVNSGFKDSYPSSLYDSTFDFAEPLFIYKNAQTSSVNFYGSWSVETISPTVGERGQILNRQNILTYNITSESTIGTVTEKINGVTVGTKTLTSGQNTTVNITQAQWDAIPYGKYRNNSAGRNTIEIVTPNNTFTYTFEKWFDNTLDVISATKAVKDSKDYYLPSAKKILSDAINSKGGSTTPTDSIERMAGFVTSGSGVKYKEGTSISTATLESFTNGSGSVMNSYSITLDFSVLGFVPKNIIYFNALKSTQAANSYISEKYYINGNNYADVLAVSTNGSSTFHLRSIIDNQTIKLPVAQESATIKWIAYE